MGQEQFSIEDIQNRLTLTLIFERPEPKSSLLDLYLAGYLSAKFKIWDEEAGDFKDEDNAFIVDKVKLNPTKSLQPLVGRKLTFEEMRKELGEDWADGKAKVLINSLHTKINQIYAKQKLYGREVKDFRLA